MMKFMHLFLLIIKSTKSRASKKQKSINIECCGF